MIFICNFENTKMENLGKSWKILENLGKSWKI